MCVANIKHRNRHCVCGGVRLCGYWGWGRRNACECSRLSKLQRRLQKQKQPTTTAPVALHLSPGGVCCLCPSPQAATSQQQHPQQQHHHQRLGRKDTPTTKATSSSSSIVVPLQGVLELGGGSLQVNDVDCVPDTYACCAFLCTLFSAQG